MAFQLTSLRDGSVRNLEEIIDPEPRMVKRWQQQWQIYLNKLALDRGGTEHWSWTTKARHYLSNDNSILFALEAGGRCQGIMVVVWPIPSRLQDEVDCMEVAFLEAAPWNRGDVAGRARELAGVGPLLMYAAVRFSESLGYQGRLSLLAIPSAEWFYDRIEMTLIGIEEIEPGESMKRFEFTAERATAFLARHEELE